MCHFTISSWGISSHLKWCKNLHLLFCVLVYSALVSSVQGKQIFIEVDVSFFPQILYVLLWRSLFFWMWDNERWITLRKASFCSRCLLIRGRRWSQSADIPSLSWLPHQSSSRRYSCSRLSNTLHTWTDIKSWWHHNSTPAPSLDMRKHKLWESVLWCVFEVYLFRRLVEGHRGIDKLQAVLHLQHQLLPVNCHFLGTASNCLWIIVTCL